MKLCSQNIFQTPNSVEQAAVKSIAEGIDFFCLASDTRVGSEGIYFLFNDEVYLLTVNVEVVRKLNADDKVPVSFIPEQT